jgi:hypothetical protein
MISYGNSNALAVMDDPEVATLPWVFRVLVPGWPGGWPR